MDTGCIYGNSKSKTIVTLSKIMLLKIPDHIHIFILEQENLQSFKKLGEVSRRGC